ncbi:GATA zinc finger domain-containing protein 10 [Ceratocystis fimbriata CBS 114723]|uniref:GATA zinc finger domain-containing protein 10 n=1 Tax=Ceratocystis fimbriata CBS 114723 TaxID=1035309 RepID=A0A2C5WL42_9PEZI|nr:GATA zinc finger domain-containing protein 10 [Ceratocystis fimbriata CBS 114723]
MRVQTYQPHHPASVSTSTPPPSQYQSGQNMEYRDSIPRAVEQFAPGPALRRDLGGSGPRLSLPSIKAMVDMEPVHSPSSSSQQRHSSTAGPGTAANFNFSAPQNGTHRAAATPSPYSPSPIPGGPPPPPSLTLTMPHGNNTNAITTTTNTGHAPSPFPSDHDSQISPSTVHHNYGHSTSRDSVSSNRFSETESHINSYPRYSPANMDPLDRTRSGSQSDPSVYMSHGVPTPPTQTPSAPSVIGIPSGPPGPPLPQRFQGQQSPEQYPHGQFPLPVFREHQQPRPTGDVLNSRDYRESLVRASSSGHTITNFVDHYLRAADEQAGAPPALAPMPTEREVTDMINNTELLRQSLLRMRTHIAERGNMRMDETGSDQAPPRRASEPRRRRGRAAPPGRCHSCARVDTPEWRRGPDGARTLCNACGLHYAKLERKRTNEQRAENAKNNAAAANNGSN